METKASAVINCSDTNPNISCGLSCRPLTVWSRKGQVHAPSVPLIISHLFPEDVTSSCFTGSSNNPVAFDVPAKKTTERLCDMLLHLYNSCKKKCPKLVIVIGNDDRGGELTECDYSHKLKFRTMNFSDCSLVEFLPE